MTTFGGWTPFGDLSDDAKAVFKDGISHLLGVDYSPVAVATQVVNGMNYCFFCNASIPSPNTSTYPAMVEMYVSPEKGVSITHISRVSY